VTELLRISAFSNADAGGNPAGVHLSEELPTDMMMQKIAADVGYSETAFASPMPGMAADNAQSDGERFNKRWRVRYFSPEAEVPFCGHATIALGAALANRYGSDIYTLVLNDATITVEGKVEEQPNSSRADFRVDSNLDSGAAQINQMSAALQSPPTYSREMPPELLSSILDLFNYSNQDLNSSLPPAFIHAGADHAVLPLQSRDKLAAMAYPFEPVKKLMVDAGLITIMFVYSETARLFHVRNAFAFGGVVEDPATGAAAAAFSGYLRDIDWAHGGKIDIVQGEDMGLKSLLSADIPIERGSSIRVSGTARFM